jgi:hypothetical protein
MRHFWEVKMDNWRAQEDSRLIERRGLDPIVAQMMRKFLTKGKQQALTIHDFYKRRQEREKLYYHFFPWAAIDTWTKQLSEKKLFSEVN